MLVNNAADELGPYGIRVNAVRPASCPPTLGPAGDERADPHRLPGTDALGRLGDVDDIAGAVTFLAGPDSTWITGQCIGVDGGHALRRGPDLGGLVGDYFDDLVAERFSSGT